MSYRGLDPNTPAARLETARRARVLSQQELADLSGVSRVAIARIEAGTNTNPRPSTIRRLAVALDVAPTWLMYGEEPDEMMGKAAA